jgi:hypothetical protein
VLVQAAGERNQHQPKAPLAEPPAYTVSWGKVNEAEPRHFRCYPDIKPANIFISLRNTRQLESGVAAARVTLKGDDASPGTIDFLAGFFGVGQNSVDNALFPIISWSVVRNG